MVSGRAAIRGLVWASLCAACHAPESVDLAPAAPPPAAPAPDEPPARDRCPDEMAEVAEGGPFCIDRWEAHLEVRAPDGASWLPHSPYKTVDALAAPYRAASAPGFVPQGYVSAAQARAACAAAGKRLCTRREHLNACRGPEKTVYPYGNQRDPRACNEGRPGHPVARLFGALARPAFLWGKALNDPRINQQADTLRPAGASPGCVSAYGVYDLVGNLHEWVDDGRDVFAGGYYVDAEVNGSGCSYTTRAHGRTYHDYSTGFRCCL
jgi:hypothetical protein